MAFHLSMQSAPEWRGDFTQPTAWVGSTPGTSIPVISGRFTGRLSSTYTLSVLTGGTINTTQVITVFWVFAPPGGVGESGRLELGLANGYNANVRIPLHADMLISFPTGFLTSGNSTTFVATSARRLPRSFHRVAGKASPDDVILQTAARQPLDQIFMSDAGDMSVLSKRRGHNPTLEVHYQNNAVKRQIEHMEGLRQTVTVGENYDADTVFLYRGGGLEPMIGAMFTNGRGTISTYWDHRSGQLKRALGPSARTAPGVQFESVTGTGPQDRNYIPLRYKHVGKALSVSSASVINLLFPSHPTPLPAAGSLAWAQTAGSPGTPTLAFAHGILGVIDPDDVNWPAGMGQGVLQVHFDATESIQTTGFATVSGSLKYMASIWARGRGNLVFAVYGGISVPPNTLKATFVKPDEWGAETDWQRFEVEFTTGATENRAALRITCTSGSAVAYIAAMQIVRSDHKQPAMYEPAILTSFTRNPETYQIVDRLPQQEGTLQFWYQDNGDDGAGASPSNYSLVQSTTGRFEIRLHLAGPDSIEFHTDGSGNPLVALLPTQQIVGEWRHVAVVWKHVPSASITRKIYINGVNIIEDDSTFWESWGGNLTIFPTFSGVTPIDWCIQELRIDRRELTADEILDCYQRFTDDKWIHIQRLYWGREFRIGAIADRWVHPALPHVLIADVNLIESSVHESSLVGDP